MKQCGRFLRGSTLLLWLAASVVAAAPTTEVIPLNYGLAESLIPVIQPMLQDDERLSAYGSQLIVRAEPERIEDIRNLIADLDRKPARLKISVASNTNVTGRSHGHRIDGRFGSETGSVVIGTPGEHNRGRIIRRETRSAADGVRQITANEGYPVLIQSGHSVPLATRSMDAYGQIVEQTHYRDVTQGFYATVRLNGDMATISLEANDDRMNRNDNQRIDTRHTNTQITARLGEWVTVGALGDAETAESRDIGRRTTTRQEDSGSIRLMIERLD
ncbi:secretin N-terminal domain-containing protein [Pseudomonas profundi]|uniref:secretin N-terminal domain-containing protein n=1 Tax=Pseudomonas profundi TaxID=1981513 RepID=UPI00123A4E34|nr:secretin N-terminal domain-containing protein [Pseudomonas profundi]